MTPPRPRVPDATDAPAEPARSAPGRARAILARAGASRPPEPGDELPADVAEALAARRAPARGEEA